MISLGQIALLAIGTWIGARLIYGTDAPVPAPAPAHRRDHVRDRRRSSACPRCGSSGLHLALITLMARRRRERRPDRDRLPERRRRLHRPDDRGRPVGHQPVSRPADRRGRRRVLPLRRRRRRADVPARARSTSRASPGARGRRSARASRPPLAAGVNITLYKLWAFALASFMTGVAGCLLAAHVGAAHRRRLPDAGLADAARDGADRRHLQLWGAVVAGMLHAARCRSSSRPSGASTRTSS